MAKIALTQNEKLRYEINDRGKEITAKIRGSMGYTGITPQEIALLIGLSRESAYVKIKNPLNMKVSELMAIDKKLNLGLFSDVLC